MDNCGYITPISGCFLKWWYPQIIHFNRVFHYKPSILGIPLFLETPKWSCNYRLTSHDPWPGAPFFFAPKTRSRSPRPPSAAPPKTPPLSSEPVDFVQSQGRDAKMLLRQRLTRTTVCNFDPRNLSLEITLPETNISPENGWLED